VRSARSFLFACGVLGIVACHESREPPRGREVPSHAPEEAVSAASETARSDDVRPVYPLDEGGAPDPLAVRLCSALHDIPEQRRASCCAERPGVVVTGECQRVLSAALRTHAAVLYATEVDRCVQAIDRRYEGCEWVGPFAPALPEECQGIVRGRREARTSCRSSLECGSGLHCEGSGPTRPGVCRPPGRSGDACGDGADVLAAYTRQTSAESEHPECEGYCDSHRCFPFQGKGAACTFSGQCGRETDCVAGACAPRRVARLGESCLGGLCAASARCLHGRCVEPLRSGEACANDFECVGACLKGDAGHGVCGQRCDVR
jgi:hypothetical protein